MKTVTWNDENIPELPPHLFCCPICGDMIHIEEITGMVEDEETGLWIADEFSINCVSAPDIESDEWDDWFGWHWSMPYVYWLPVSEKVEKWLEQNYRFTDEKNGVQ